MKFAVVEYNSKSGGIWKHSPETPNYRANPKTEIDPTSFGCYVSALEGEHIPLLGIIKPNIIQKVAKRITGNWLQTYPLSYFEQFDVLMVVHQLSDAHEILRFIKRLQRSSKPPFIIGVPTQPYGLLVPELEADEKQLRTFAEYMNACDVFLSVVRSTVSWYERHTSTPVVYMPQPYPTSYASQYAKSRGKKQKDILVAGVTQRDNITQGQIVARELQKRHPEYRIIIPRVSEYDYDFENLEGATYEILPFEQWQDHLQTLSNTTLVVNTDYTQTRGRVQTDCAAVGTPSLGGNSDGQIDLFSTQASNPDTLVEEIIAEGEKLLRDPSYYEEVTKDALERLRKYDYEESAARIHALVRNYRSL